MRYVSIGLLIGVGLLVGCQQSKPAADEGVSIKSTLPKRVMVADSEPPAANEVSLHTSPSEQVSPEEAAAAATQIEPAPVKPKKPAMPVGPAVTYAGEAYGGEVTTPSITVAEFLETVATLEGEVVTVEGTLGQVCQDMGCWFFLQAPGAAPGDPQIYVDLQMGAIFVIPEDSAGKHAVVQGKVTRNGKKWKLIGKGVVLS